MKRRRLRLPRKADSFSTSKSRNPPAAAELESEPIKTRLVFTTLLTENFITASAVFGTFRSFKTSRSEAKAADEYAQFRIKDASSSGK